MKKIVILLLGILGFTFFSGFAGAADVDVLIKKLVEKHILNEKEAKELVGEMQQETAKKKENASGIVPEWVGKTKVNGDLRLRYEDVDLNSGTASKSETKRPRVRLRVGVESEVNDQVKVGFGIATGSSGWDSARSTNQTLGEDFGSKSVAIDYAYATYSPCKAFSLTGGKFKNPLFNPGDLLWDSDIMPEGLAAKFTWNSGHGLDLSLIPAFFYLADDSQSSDPYLLALEPGIKWKINKYIELKTSVSYFDFSHMDGRSVFADTEGTNTLTVAGANKYYRYEYDSWHLATNLGFSNLAVVPYASIFGQYIHATDPGDDNNGYLVGIRFGSEKVKKSGQWQFKYMNRRLEKDAWLDSLPDADILGGDTNIKSNEFILEYALVDNLRLDMDYYRNKRLDADMDENVLQIDLLFNF